MLRAKRYSRGLLFLVAAAGISASALGPGAGKAGAARSQAASNTCFGGLPSVASVTVGSAGAHLRAAVTGGDVTVDIPPGAIPSGTTVIVCTAPPASAYAGDPALSFFAIDFPGNGRLQTVGLAAPFHITLSGKELTPHSYLLVQGGGLPRLVSNIDAASGRLSFDAYAIFEYAVLARSPFAPPNPSGPGSTHSGPTSNARHRSTIATALTPLDKAFPLTWRTFWNAFITLAVMLLITFPAQLFNKTLDENYEEIRAILHRRLRTPAKVRTKLASSGHRSANVASFAVVMAGGSIIGGLNDPTFGFNTKSVETFVAVVAAFAVSIVLSAGVEIAYRRRRRLAAAWSLRALPLGLVIALACMLVSRLTGFQPGYLYGVIAGIVFREAVGNRERGHGVALASLATLVLAVVAWAAWTPVATSASHPHANAFVLTADTFLAGLFISGIVGTVVALVPLEFMPGSALARWHRGAWMAVFTVATFLLIQVMLHPAARSRRIPDAPIVTTAVLFGVFGLISVAFNRYFALRARRGTGRREEDDAVLMSPPQRVQSEP